MKLMLDSLTLEHFRSWSGPTTLDAAELGTGLHFVRGRNKLDPQLGSNGAGKSSLWGALTWCLYGRTPEGLHNVDIRPWADGGSPIVSLVIDIDGTKHVIQRSIGSLTLNDRTVGQEQIDELLGLSYDVFCTSVVMGQGQPLFPDLSSSQKMKLFDAVMDLDRWTLRSKHASNRVDEIETGIHDLDKQLGTIDGALLSLQQSIDNIKHQILVWENEQEQKRQRLAKDQKQLEKQLHELELKHNDADLRLDSALTELRPLQKQMRDIADKANELKRELDKADRLKQDLAAMKGKICPLCKQPIRGNQLAEHKAELLKRLLAYGDAEEQLPELAKQYDTLVKAEANFQAKSDMAQLQLNELSPKVGALKREIEYLQEHQNKVERNPYREHLKDLWTKQKQGKDQLAELEKQKRIKERSRIRTEFWVKGFKDVRLYAIEEVLQELELMTNSMLEEVGLIGWSVQYAIERETKSGTVQRGINCTILCPGNSNPVKWTAWSGGESQRLRIICTLALSEVLLGHAGITTQFEILDEPTMHLSNEGIDDLIEYLSERARQSNKTIFYADQHSIESSRFTSVITVVKTKNGSIIQA